MLLIADKNSTKIGTSFAVVGPLAIALFQWNKWKQGPARDENKVRWNIGLRNDHTSMFLAQYKF